MPEKAAEGRRHRLTWGQMNIAGWMKVAEMDPTRNVVIGDLGPAAGAATREAAVAALTVLIERHEALRTLFVLPADADPPYATLREGLRQEVLAADPATQIDAAAGVHSTPDLLASLYDDYQGSGSAVLDPAARPVGFLLYERPDGRWGSILIASHMATDGSGLRLLSAEYEALLRGTSAAGLPPAAQPWEIAAVEHGDEGARIDDRNIAWMEGVLRSLPADHLVIAQRKGNFLSGASFSSKEFHDDLGRLASRWRVPRGGVLIGVLALAAWRAYGWPQIALRTLVRMPDIVRGKSYVGASGIPSLVSVPVEPDLTVHDYLRRAWAAVVSGYRASPHDPASFHRLQAGLAAELGAPAIDGLLFLNYHPVADAYDAILARDYEDSPPDPATEEGQFSEAWTGGNFYRAWMDAAAASTATRLSLTYVGERRLAARQAQELMALARRLARDDGHSRLRAVLAELG